MFKSIASFWIVICFFAAPTVVSAGTYYNGKSAEVVDVQKVYEKLRAGQVLVVSELHDSEAHHENQRQILLNLAKIDLPVSVGMEFFDYTEQIYVDMFGRGQTSEADFLTYVSWGKTPFDFYRTQVLLPYSNGGRTYALNFPRELSGQVARGGLEALLPDDLALLPPNFTLGVDSYFERFSATMSGHVSEEKIKNYFTAQSIWDDTMAWRAAEAMKENPDQILVIIVGDFHVAYQDGLIARLKARGLQNVLSVSQVDSTDMSPEEREELISPHAVYGSRADFIFDVGVLK